MGGKKMMMRRVLFACTISAIGASLLMPAPAHAAAGPVVISELNYHAYTDVSTDDFIELANAGDQPIDISGWSFTAGIGGVLPAGSVIPAGGRFVGSPDATAFQTLYGFAPDFVYTGNLSNSGEQVTLVDGALAEVDSVTYADSGEWPPAPDGNGPSLELRGLLADNTDPDNWGASTVTGGTPGAVNSLDGTVPPPRVKNLTVTPLRPDPGQAVTISGKLPVGSTATLTYKVMYGAEVTVPFLDDAASPGGAGDGVFAASVPGQTAGHLVRYRISASSAGVPFTAPAAGDTINYEGYVVRNPAVVTNLPVIEWFMSDAVYNDMLANHRYDDYLTPVPIAYNGQVFDNAMFRIKGQSTRSAAKVSWAVELPGGHTLDWPSIPYPVKKFALQRDPEPNAQMSWEIIKDAGAKWFSVDRIRTQRNGQFHSVGGFLQDDDSFWRKYWDVDNWAIYKGDAGALAKTSSQAVLQSRLWLDKKSREDEDYTDVWELSQIVDAPASASQQRWIANNVNVPELVNYMAINSLVRHTDSGYHNWFVARDTEGTGRWEMWHWDLDVTFFNVSTDKFGTFLDPSGANRLNRAIMAYPEWRQMYFRRLKTLIDTYYRNGDPEARYDEITKPYRTPDWDLENAKWNLGSWQKFRRNLHRATGDRREVFADNTGAGQLIPISQTAAPRMVISEINYQPTNPDTEYVELYNPTDQAIDLSGWTLDGVGLTIQSGTVVLPGGRVVFVADDTAFRSVYNPGTVLIGGEFSGGLSDSGETLTLSQGSRVVDTVTYSPSAPWPTAAAGGGASLELLDPGLDNDVAASWAASSGAGTPGLANSKVAPADTTDPVAPAATTADAVRNGVAVSWSAGSDDRAVQRYRVLRDGAPIATVDAELLRYVDRSVPAGTPHVYSVQSVDGAGNQSPPGPSAAAVAGNPVLVAFDDFDGADGSAWSNAWATEDLDPSLIELQGGQGHLSIGPGAGTFARGKLIEPAKQADGTLLASYTWGDGTVLGKLSFWLRAGGGWKNAFRPANGYGVTLRSRSTTVLLQRATNSGLATIGSTSGAQVTTPGVKQWIRFQVVGSTVRVRIWNDGTPEPSGWEVAATNTQVTAPGRVYVAGYGGRTATKSIFVDDVALSAN
ncbi:lamin tail domain-containing protein [Nocardioides sp.]|uniref:lamin tail domain-containing protein n=1 Tax=Nocardioides sp. TaxID=35761 RepID=UPI003527F984